MQNAEVKRLTSLAEQNHDASAVAALIPFIERMPPAPDFSRILSWIWTQLNSDHVKHNGGSLFSQNLLRGVASVTKHAGTTHANTLIDTVFPGVFSNRHNIWRCVRAVHAQVVNNAKLNYSIRLLAGRTNMTILILFKNLTSATPGVVPILLQMAHLEMMAGSADLNQHQDVILKLNEYLRPKFEPSEFAWDREVLGHAGGDAATIASVAVWHLTFRQSHMPNDCDAASRDAAIANSLQYIEELSRNPSIREGLVSHNCIPILVEVLKDLSDRPPTRPEQFDHVVDEVCIALISLMFASVDLERKIVAYEAGIIPALMRCSKYFTAPATTIYSDKNLWHRLLFQALPSFMIYPSICRVAKREIHKFKEQLLPPKVVDLYTKMNAMLDGTSALKPVKSSMQPCEKCQNGNGTVAPKLCTGCSRVYYCSRLCQRNDWEAHRDRCKWNQSHYHRDILDALSLKDYAAIPALLQHELRLRFSQIIRISRMFGLEEPLNVEIDYTVFPFVIAVGSARFIPEEYPRLPKTDRDHVDKLRKKASRTPGSILTRYYYSERNLERKLSEVLVMDQPTSMPYNAEASLSERYYAVQVRKYDGSYVAVHQPQT